MCTLTWRAVEEGGYDLFFNRDELNTRGSEMPPQAGEREGVRFLAPRDGDHGGSWLVLNEYGLTVCLLNYYPHGRTGSGAESRGQLPPACAVCANVDAVARAMQARTMRTFAPFHLVAVDAEGSAIHLRWDGVALHEAPAPRFLTSSSFEPARIEAERAEKFAAVGAWTEEAQAEFHRAHDPAAGAASVCMRRPDASTRSVCRVRVRAAVRELCYEPVGWEGGGEGRMLFRL